jgi:ribosomal protein S27AE
MPSPNKMICPNCGFEMNHHANKIDYSASEEGNILLEVHTCPNCGQSQSRESPTLFTIEE